MFEFAWPWVFLLLPLPLLVYWLAPPAKVENIGLRVPFFDRIRAIDTQSHASTTSKKWLKIIALIVIWILVLLACAKPQRIGDPITLPKDGRDLFVAFDISMSMVENRMRVENNRLTRLEVVRYILGEFVQRRKGDRVGLILFGSNAYLQSPLTFDLATVHQYINEAQAGFAGPSTAIGDAIGLAVKRLKDRPEGRRVLILFTDGENNAGEVLPRRAADLAEQAGVKIYTVGFGESSRSLDEQTLQYAATKTGGEYFRARSAQELNGIYNYIDELEPVEQEENVFRPVITYFYYPLIAALIVSLMVALLNSSIIYTARTLFNKPVKGEKL